MVSAGQNPNDALGIVISYSVRVALNCGALGGELVADLPFKLVHPSPGKKGTIRTMKDLYFFFLYME